MEKNLGRIKTLVIILLAVLLTLIAFGGLYVKRYGIWSNILPNYKYGMELSGFRELHFILDDSEEEKEIYVDENGNYMGDVKESSDSSDDGVSVSMVDEEGNPVENPETTEETSNDNNDIGYSKETRVIKANPEENVNKDNFEKVKSIIQKRLEEIDSYEYNIRQNDVTGEIIIEVPDDENLTTTEMITSTVGKISIVDYQTGVVLLDDSHVRNAKLLASNTGSGYQAYIQLTFDKEGKEVLKNISNTYKKVVDEQDNESITYVSVKLDDSTLISTYFGDVIESGLLQIPYGEAMTTYEDYYQNARSASIIASIINGDSLPLKYSLNSDNYINTSPSNTRIAIVFTVFAILVLIISIVMIIRYKKNSIKYVGAGIIYISLLNIICRYTNVTITINSLITYLCVIIINYAFYFNLLEKIKAGKNVKEALGATLKKLYLSIIPVIIISVIFTFMSNVVISSIGMLLFWGLVMQILLSLIAIF